MRADLLRFCLKIGDLGRLFFFSFCRADRSNKSLLVVHATLLQILNTKSSVHICKRGGWNLDRTIGRENNLYFKHFKQEGQRQESGKIFKLLQSCPLMAAA